MIWNWLKILKYFDYYSKLNDFIKFKTYSCSDKIAARNVSFLLKFLNVMRLRAGEELFHNIAEIQTCMWHILNISAKVIFINFGSESECDIFKFSSIQFKNDYRSQSQWINVRLAILINTLSTWLCIQCIHSSCLFIILLTNITKLQQIELKSRKNPQIQMKCCKFTQMSFKIGKFVHSWVCCKWTKCIISESIHGAYVSFSQLRL